MNDTQTIACLRFYFVSFLFYFFRSKGNLLLNCVNTWFYLCKHTFLCDDQEIRQFFVFFFYFQLKLLEHFVHGSGVLDRHRKPNCQPWKQFFLSFFFLDFRLFIVVGISHMFIEHLRLPHSSTTCFRVNCWVAGLATAMNDNGQHGLSVGWKK